MKKPMTFEEHLAQEMQDPEFRAEWEALEPMREILQAIIDGKPLTGYTPEQIADAADVSLEEARVIVSKAMTYDEYLAQKMQRGKQPRATRQSSQQAHASAG